MNGTRTSTPPRSPIPVMLGVRVGDLAPALAQWRTKHPGISWSWMAREAIRAYLAPKLGKRYAHLVRVDS